MTVKLNVVKEFDGNYKSHSKTLNACCRPLV